MKPGQDRIVSHTEAEWNARDPVLADGEIGINRNGGRLKYGDGVTPWSQLLYLDQNYATTTDIAQVGADVAEVRQKAEKVDALSEQVADYKARLDDVRADVTDIKKKLPPAASSSAVDLPA